MPGNKFTAAAQLTNIQSKADRTWKLTFNTQELGEDAAMLTELLMDQGWLLFSPNDDFTEEDVPEVKAETGLKDKTPGERLRAVLYVYWKQRGGNKTWEQFYLEQMGRLTELIKDKLEPEEG